MQHGNPVVGFMNFVAPRWRLAFKLKATFEQDKVTKPAKAGRRKSRGAGVLLDGLGRGSR